MALARRDLLSEGVDREPTLAFLRTVLEAMVGVPDPAAITAIALVLHCMVNALSSDEAAEQLVAYIVQVLCSARQPLPEQPSP
jgi:hypothetical protein